MRILSDETDVFVLLVYWVWRANVHSAVQMEKWDGTILDILNATVRTLGEKCQGLLGMHALSGCDSVSYSCGKGKVTALKVLLGSAMSGLNTVPAEADATHSDLKHTGTEFSLALYGMKKAQSLSNARYQIYRQRKPPELKSFQLISRSCCGRLQTRGITKFGWEVTKGGAVMTVVSTEAVAPVNLLDVISCGCSAFKAS